MLRTIYKALKYGTIITMSYIYTVNFKLHLKINSAKYGKHLKCYKSTPILRINRKGYLRLGNNVIFNSYTDHSWYSRCYFWVMKQAELTIGNNSGMNGVMVFCSRKISIGDNVKIGGGTRISDTDHHSLNYIERRDAKLDSLHAASDPINIGDDVFIGANCYIGKGVSIGNRSIVAAGSVVVKSIPADEVWGGNPARLLRKI